MLRIQSIARSLGNLVPMSPEMAERVYPEKYRDQHVAAYWDYCVRQLRRANLRPVCHRAEMVASHA